MRINMEYLEIIGIWLLVLFLIFIIFLLFLWFSINVLIAVKELINAIESSIHKFISGYKNYE